MGAHAAGELASRLAVDGVSHLYHKYHEFSPPEALQKAILETNGEVHRRGQANSDFHNMGTTVSVLVMLPQGALIAHIGDSRVYRLRNDHLHQLTRDHSLIWELREQLAETGDLAVPKNVITRSLGPNASVQVDVEGPLPTEPGDIFLVCSDGLTGRVTDEELAPILKNLPPKEAGHLLIDLANLRGGPDNITVIVAKVVGEVPTTADAEPIRIGTKRGPSAIQPAIWVCCAVCILAALVFAMTNNLVPAIAAGAGAIVALLVGLLARQRANAAGISLGNGRKLGEGPYTETVCPSSEKSVDLLRGITRELRENVNTEAWSINWTKFDNHCQAGQQSEQSGQSIEAMRDYGRAIRHLMQEVREEQNRRANDSTIDY
jgi:protein phosphatase